MPKNFYITTPIYYPSDNLHLGHCYTTVFADAIARYKRARGLKVMFLTGTDEHGQKIETKAREQGLLPKEYVDKIVQNIKDLWRLLNISNDRFVRTTDEFHTKTVKKVFNILFKKGDIYKGIYSGKYCLPCEALFTEQQLKDGKCPDCGRKTVDFREDAYFFKLSKYQQPLQKFYKEHPDFIMPETRSNEMFKNFIEIGLSDVCVSRKSVNWGINIDFAPEYTIYVWIDALLNYLSALGFENNEFDNFNEFWPADIHLVGKEIMRFHSIIWPALLMALELPLPKQVVGHGWMLMNGDKMSKSKKNIVDPNKLCELYGVDAIRYFLLKEASLGGDFPFSNELLINIINSDLANNLGNLISRTAAMIEKYFNKILSIQTGENKENSLDLQLKTTCLSAIQKVENYMENYNTQSALKEILKISDTANKYIDETAPWVLAKSSENNTKLATVLLNLIKSIRIISVLISPFMPETAEKIAKQFNFSGKFKEWSSAKVWEMLPNELIISKEELLFPRIEQK